MSLFGEPNLLTLRLSFCTSAVRVAAGFRKKWNRTSNPCRAMDGIHVNSHLNPCYPAGYCFTFT